MTPSAPLQELHAFYDSLPSGICLLSTDGREQILFASQGLLSLYACRTQEEFQALTGSRFRDMVDPEDYRPLEIVSHPSNDPLARTQGPIHPFLTFRIRPGRATTGGWRASWAKRMCPSWVPYGS